jgi:hypothetical protein
MLHLHRLQSQHTQGNLFRTLCQCEQLQIALHCVSFDYLHIELANRWYRERMIETKHNPLLCCWFLKTYKEQKAFGYTICCISTKIILHDACMWRQACVWRQQHTYLRVNKTAYMHVFEGSREHT